MAKRAREIDAMTSGSDVLNAGKKEVMGQYFADLL
jgi:hypothetical protein